MVIWFVCEVGEEFYVIDYYENFGEGFWYYMKVLKDCGYEYGEYWGLYDIENCEFVVDVKFCKELVCEGYEIDGWVYLMNFCVVFKVGIDIGIELVCEIFKFCVFDEEKCVVGIFYFEGYCKEWDDKCGCWKDKFFYDFILYGVDSFCYFVVVKNNCKQVGIVFF